MPKLLQSRSKHHGAPRTQSDFLANWPGSTCKKLDYAIGLTVYVLRLANGRLVAVCGNDIDAWEKGYAVLEKSMALDPRTNKALSLPLPLRMEHVVAL